MFYSINSCTTLLKCSSPGKINNVVYICIYSLGNPRADRRGEDRDGCRKTGPQLDRKV